MSCTRPKSTFCLTVYLSAYFDTKEQDNKHVSNKMSRTFSIHLCFEASLKSTGPTLIPMSFVNWTLAVHVSLSFTGINTIPVNTSLEESRAAYNRTESKERTGGVSLCH